LLLFLEGIQTESNAQNIVGDSRMRQQPRAFALNLGFGLKWDGAICQIWLADLTDILWSWASITPAHLQIRFFCAFTYGTRFSLPRVPFKRRKHVLRVSLEPKSQGNEGLHSNIHCLIGVGPLPCWLPVADCQHLQWRATCLAGIGPGNWRFPRNPKALSKCVISPIL